MKIGAKNERGSEDETEPSEVQSFSIRLHPPSQLDERDLEQHEPQHNGSDDSEDHCQQKLVEESTEEEGNKLGDGFALFVLDYQF